MYQIYVTCSSMSDIDRFVVRQDLRSDFSDVPENKIRAEPSSVHPGAYQVRFKTGNF